jgi:Ca-activated chloride channel family protein
MAGMPGPQTRQLCARLAVAAALVCAAAMVTAQQTTFSSRIDAVRVDVLVTENGTPVRNLGRNDFEVFDNGVKQDVDLVSFEQLPLNVVLTLDMSDSMVGERLANLRAAGLALVDGLKADDQAALVNFSEIVSLGAALTSDKAQVRAALQRAEPDGNTSLIDASFAGMVLGESRVGRALVVVFSDGLDTSSWLASKAVLDIARRCDVVVYAVSAARGVKMDFLRELCERTGGRLFELDTTDRLSAVFLQVLDEFRQRYLVSYSPRGVPDQGWHRVTVRVKGRNLDVKARPGYFAGR